ncbi:hypothetical protein F7Q99_12580 [Streptomyces kaniharaensis]|uniref:Uncharacterized protein n=1 Tax=Streptomyces kaniharaensis TaxID=212423 RepID=A0A6N7KNK5_9ACTN|nr:hypothetical protein [Streptomyces kaniharaensis]MQS13096.1 hypothetical protein [Streptomyces kaniharaensis]
MRTRQLRDEPLPTAPPAARAFAREPVLLGDVLFHTLAEIARRAPGAPAGPAGTAGSTGSARAAGPEPRLPAQRTRPHP